MAALGPVRTRPQEHEGRVRRFGPARLIRQTAASRSGLGQDDTATLQPIVAPWENPEESWEKRVGRSAGLEMA